MKTPLAITLLAILSILVTMQVSASTPNSVAISLLITGESKGSPEAFVVEDGSYFTVRKLVHAAVLIEHPEGNLLWDTGLGRNIDQAFEQNGWLLQQLFAYDKTTPAIDQLAEENITEKDLLAIIPSHLHWDHVGGLPDFPNTPVWAQKQSVSEATEHGHRPAYLPELLLDTTLWQFFELDAEAYEGFSHSKDLFGDGKLVLVDLEGHTPGHLGLFINLNSGQRYFLIGDATWTEKGFKENKPRPSIVSWISPVDWHLEENNQIVEKIHQLHQQKPELIIIPAHDEVAAQKIPLFPNRGY